MSHTIRLTQNPDKTWNYSCSCKRLKKDRLKFKASAVAVHAAHLKSVAAIKLAK